MTWTRRKFIKAGIFSALGLLLTDAIWAESFFIETKEFFPGSKNGAPPDIKIVQVSDLHIQTLRYPLRQLARQLNTTRPDLICITGDAVDKAEKLEVLDAFLGQIDYDIKKVAITGNWEYWGRIDLDALQRIYAKHNGELLINASRRYSFRGKSISITGIDDYIGGHADIKTALQEFNAADYHIVLNHCPAYSDTIVAATPPVVPIDIILSGHTHGGQINLLGFVPFKPRGSGKYLKGWYQVHGKSLYVSKGIGTSILPARFMSRAEIAIFNLLKP